MNSLGAISLTLPDGRPMRSHVVGLAYTDSVTGQGVLIAQIQDSLGFLDPPNQVIYLNAFSGVQFPVVRFNSDGNRDTNFPGVSVYAFGIGTDSSGRILVCGSFHQRIVRIFPDGTPDYSFYAGHRYSVDPGIYVFVIRPNSNIVIGGPFNAIAGRPSARR